MTGIDLQGGPNNHQPPNKNTVPPNTPSDYSCQSLMYHTPSRSRSPGEKAKHGASNTSCEKSEESQDDWCLLPNKDTAISHWEFDFFCILFADTPEGPAFLRQLLNTKCQWVVPDIPRRSLWPPDHTCQTSDEFWGNYHTSPPLPPSLTPDSCVEHGNT